MARSTETSPLLIRDHDQNNSNSCSRVVGVARTWRYMGMASLVLVVIVACAAFVLNDLILQVPLGMVTAFLVGPPTISTTSSIKVAFAGNSMQYYSDLPRLMEHMLHTKFDQVVQDSCFQGDSTISSLWTRGNTVGKTLRTKAAERADGTFDIGASTVQALLAEQEWDFLVLNDFTQSPARLESRMESKKALEEHYVPILRQEGTTLILLETAAYEYPGLHNTNDLGSFDDYTTSLHEGYLEYQNAMQKLNCSTLVAPNALAFSFVRYHKPDLFHKLYAPDHHHPSPHGTWMEACVLYCTMMDELPPKYDVAWWNTSRYVVPNRAFPTDDEAEEIRQIAGCICEID